MKQDKKLSQLTKERFVALLARSLESTGLDTVQCGAILCAVRWSGSRPEQDYAIAVESKRGVLWGFSNGGAIGLKGINPSCIVSATSIMGVTGEPVKLTVTDGIVQHVPRGCYVIVFDGSDLLTK